MELNTNLRDDKFLFPVEREMEEVPQKNQASGLVVAALNKRGIYTVGDLINCEQAQLGRPNLHYLNALIQILRYKYLGEVLVNDVLLENAYGTHSYEKLAKDLRRLGFGRNLDDCRLVAKRFLDTYKSDIPPTMEQCLRDENIRIRVIGSADFRGFYLDYLEEKRKKTEQEQTQPPKDVLEALKQQLEGLLSMRDSLDKQIQDIQNQINTLNGGQHYGRK